MHRSCHPATAGGAANGGKNIYKELLGLDRHKGICTKSIFLKDKTEAYQREMQIKSYKGGKAFEKLLSKTCEE